MLRKIVLSLALMPLIVGLCGCESLRGISLQDITSGNWRNKLSNSADENIITAQPVKKATSIVVCRSHQCAPAKLSMTREYIFNSLLQLFDNNNYQKMLVCQADPLSHTCIEDYITLPVKVGVVPTNAYIDSVKITDVIVGKKGSSINLILNYNMTYGGEGVSKINKQKIYQLWENGLGSLEITKQTGHHSTSIKNILELLNYY